MSDFELVRRAVRLSDFISERTGVVLEPSGIDTFRGPCPIHDSDNKSTLVVNDDTGLWKCWAGCGGGSVFDFVFATRPDLDSEVGRDWGTVLHELADQFSVTLSERPGSSRGPRFSSRELKEAMTAFATAAHNVLWDQDGTEEVDEYLDSRGITEEWIERWRIGCVPSTDPVGFSLDAGDGSGGEVSEALAVAAGVLRESEGRRWSPYGGRLIVPLYDKTGRYVVGVSARMVPGVRPSSGREAKYMNTHETDIFHKSDLMYNHHRIYDKTVTTIIVVEGSFDVMAVEDSTPPTVAAVASSGTSITSSQVQALAATGKQIIFTFDGDDGGTAGFVHAATHSLTHRISHPAGISLPATSDCFDLYRDSRLSEYLAPAISDPLGHDLIEVTVDRVVQTHRDSETTTARTLAPIISAVTRSKDSDTIIRSLARGLGLTDSAARSLVHGTRRRVRKSDTGPEVPGIIGQVLTMALASPAMMYGSWDDDDHQITEMILMLTGLSHLDFDDSLTKHIGQTVALGLGAETDDPGKVGREASQYITDEVDKVVDHLARRLVPELRKNVSESGALDKDTSEYIGYAESMLAAGNTGGAMTAAWDCVRYAAMK